jgi:hypothetical protein
MIDGGCWVRADPKGAGERGWDAQLDEQMRGDGWPSTYPYERRDSGKPDLDAAACGLGSRTTCEAGLVFGHQSSPPTGSRP